MGKICMAAGLVAVCWILAAEVFGQAKEPADYVNPFIGTHGSGHTFPGAALPFGMVQLSPDNGEIGDKHYYYGHNTIIGFSHTHLSGTGTMTLAKYANILLMPTVGTRQLDPGTEREPDSGYRSRFSHDRESAAPGYYRVFLDDYGIDAELTAATRAGMHRYTFPETEQGHILIDVTRSPLHGHRGPAHIEVIGDNAIAGSTTVIEKEGDIPFTWYFYAEFSRPFDAFGTFLEGVPAEGRRTAVGRAGVGAYLDYNTRAGEQVIVRVGISHTGVKGALNNLRSEMHDWDFDGVKILARDTWNVALSRIEVVGSTRINREKLYTALYHSLLFPRTFSDVDGNWYSHFTGRVHADPGFTYYVDFSLWDTYRAVHPLFTILEPERQNHMIRSMLTMYRQGGRLPLQTTYRNFYSSAMIGDHGSTVIIDSYLKGIRDYDVETAYEAMLRNAFEPGKEDKSSREGLEDYVQMGYVPCDRVRESVSVTLENAFVDWGLGQVAKDLAHGGDHQLLLQRSQGYRNLYDGVTGFFRPRMADGSWLPECMEGQQPQIVTDGYNHYYDCWDRWWIGVSPNRHYTESNAWQYLWYVQHDVPGLIGLMGGKEAFVDRLDELFTVSSSHSGPFYEAVRGSIGQYVHGNQPSHHVAYLYNYGGAPWKTQERVRQIMDVYYGNGPRGLIGPDDMGQMSAWYVFSAIGFYPVAPGTSEYQIGSPVFEQAVIDLGDYYENRTFTVTAKNNSGDNRYIQSAALNGVVLTRPWITHEEITGGGELVFEMGPGPNKNWGVSAEKMIQE
jgi:predicted alpha-1,2-mannosidase